MDKLLFVRAEIKQLAACAADVLARDKATSGPKALRSSGDVWALEIDRLAFNLAAPALAALDEIAQDMAGAIAHDIVN